MPQAPNSRVEQGLRVVLMFWEIPVPKLALFKARERGRLKPKQLSKHITGDSREKCVIRSKEVEKVHKKSMVVTHKVHTEFVTLPVQLAMVCCMRARQILLLMRAAGI
jgi:hypothetical protein